MILTVGEGRYKYGKGRILWYRVGIADVSRNSLFLISIHMPFQQLKQQCYYSVLLWGLYQLKAVV